MIFLQIQLEKNKVLIHQFFQTTTSVVIHPAFQLVEMEAVLLLLLRFISPVHLSFVLIPYYLLKNFERKKNREWFKFSSFSMDWCVIFLISLSPLQSVSSLAQLCLTLCDPMDCSTPDFPVHHQLPELAQTHVHQVGDAIQPSHSLLSSFPPAFNLSQHQGLSPLGRGLCDWISGLASESQLSYLMEDKK